MTKEEVKEIIYDACRQFEVQTEMRGNLPYSEITEERIVIIANSERVGKYWNDTMVNVDWCVPDINDEEDGNRLKAVEHLLRAIHYGNGIKNNELYRYKKVKVSVEDDRNMRCHFVCLVLKFQTLNTL